LDFFGIVLVIAFLPIDFEAIVGIEVSLGILVFVLFLFVNFRGIRIQVTSNSLFVTYGLFNKFINFDEIESCRVVKASFGRKCGISVRHGLDGSTAYTTSFDNAVEIIPKNERVFVFSSDNSDKICEILKQ